MIICFSGTGNSRRVADQIQDLLGDELVRFPPGLMRNPKRIKLEVYDSRVIWIMPVHCWHLPRTVEQVLRYSTIFSRNPVTHYLIFTCGDDIGNADKKWRKMIKRRGWKAGAAFSVQMPNTYTFMKGFDVDPKAVADAKLVAADHRIKQIAKIIELDDVSTVDVVRGSWPWVKTSIIRPWFKWYMTRTAPFHYTDACTGCGKCARNCPLNVISMVDGHPVWRKGHCTMCLRCYNCCPNHAVAYGKATEGKGQYVCDGYTLSD